MRVIPTEKFLPPFVSFFLDTGSRLRAKLNVPFQRQLSIFTPCIFRLQRFSWINLSYDQSLLVTFLLSYGVTSHQPYYLVFEQVSMDLHREHCRKRNVNLRVLIVTFVSFTLSQFILIRILVAFWKKLVLVFQVSRRFVVSFLYWLFLTDYFSDQFLFFTAEFLVSFLQFLKWVLKIIRLFHQWRFSNLLNVNRGLNLRQVDFILFLVKILYFNYLSIINEK